MALVLVAGPLGGLLACGAAPAADPSTSTDDGSTSATSASTSSTRATGTLTEATGGDAAATEDTTGSTAALTSSSATGDPTTGASESSGEGGSSSGEPVEPPDGCEPGAPPACEPPCAAQEVCQAGACVDLGPLHPMAPTASESMWQTANNRYVLAGGVTCDAHVTVAVGDQIACYVGADDELRCAGRVFDTDYGPNFVGTGRMNVEQVLLRPTFNAANGNGMCLLEDGNVLCMGRNNNTGVYGTGSTLDVDVLTAWGASCDYTRIATGTFDQMCAWTAGGDVECAGLSFGLSPILADTAADGFWVDTFGNLNVDDPTVWRAQQGRTECTITPAGLSCVGDIVQPGAVVDGGMVGEDFFRPLPYWCALDETGTVTLATPTPATVFEPGRVLAIAYHRYPEAGPASDAPPGVCAVYDDGSLWCYGANATGRFGTGAYGDLLVETEVAPPGSVRVDCRVP
jgi:hypothetical protein